MRNSVSVGWPPPRVPYRRLYPWVEYVDQADGGTALFHVLLSYMCTFSHLPLPWQNLVLVKSIPYVFDGIREFVDVVQEHLQRFFGSGATRYRFSVFHASEQLLDFPRLEAFPLAAPVS